MTAHTPGLVEALQYSLGGPGWLNELGSWTS